jgi:hypothetical protein
MAPSTVGGATPRQRAYAMKEKCLSMPVTSIPHGPCFSSCLQVPALGSLHDGLYVPCGMKEPPFLPSCFWPVFYHRRNQIRDTCHVSSQTVAFQGSELRFSCVHGKCFPTESLPRIHETFHRVKLSRLPLLSAGLILHRCSIGHL